MNGLEFINATIDQLCGMYYTCVEMMRAGLGGQVWLEQKATYAQVANACDRQLHQMTSEADYLIADLMNEDF